MKFVEVKELPRRTVKKHVIGYITEFMNMNVKIVKVEFNDREYKTVGSAQSSFYKCITNLGFPVKAKIIDHELYLIRKDM